MSELREKAREKLKEKANEKLGNVSLVQASSKNVAIRNSNSEDPLEIKLAYNF